VSAFPFWRTGLLLASLVLVWLVLQLLAGYTATNGYAGAWVLEDAETGRAWVVQPNRVEPFRFPGVPGPR
jgi:hypothetical protein